MLLAHVKDADRFPKILKWLGKQIKLIWQEDSSWTILGNVYELTKETWTR